MRHKMHQNEVFLQLAATALANPASMCHCLRKSTDMREIFSRDPWRSDHEEGMARPSRTEGIKSGTPLDRKRYYDVETCIKSRILIIGMDVFPAFALGEQMQERPPSCGEYVTPWEDYLTGSTRPMSCLRLR
jgi:hypothetical protein